MVRSIKSAKKIKRKSKGSDKGDGSSSSSSSIPSMPAKVWQPGVEKLEEGEELQCDPLAYNSLQAFHIGWPCIRQRKLLGTLLEYLKHSTSQGKDLSQCLPNLQLETLIWRVTVVIVTRMMRMRSLVDLGVRVCKQHLVSFDILLISQNRDPWDCNNCIYLWEPASDVTWNADTKPFIGHAASVEDLQWSPSEPHVFASCSVDGTIAIWDARLGKSAAASFKAHNANVNVISWNGLLIFLIVALLENPYIHTYLCVDHSWRFLDSD